MTSHFSSGQFDNLFDVPLDIDSYFSLSLPVPRCILSRDEEIKYWNEYIDGQYHDLNMAFGSEIDDVKCRGNQEHRLALEIEMRAKKYSVVSEIIRSLENIKRYDTALSAFAVTTQTLVWLHHFPRISRIFLTETTPSFPPVGLELEGIKLAYKKWDDLEFEIIELLIEVCICLVCNIIRQKIEITRKKNSAPHCQSPDSDITSSPESWDDFNFLDLNLPQKYTTCSPVESKLSSPCCRSISSTSNRSAPNIIPDLSQYDMDSVSFKNVGGKFECPYTHCFQTFPRQNALLRHFSSIHDDAVSVVCPFCPKGHRAGKTFNRSDNFQR